MTTPGEQLDAALYELRDMIGGLRLNLSDVDAKANANAAAIAELSVEPATPKPTPTGKGFTEIDWTNSVDLPKTATPIDVQAALNNNQAVRIHAGVTYAMPLVLPHANSRLGVHGAGARPIFYTHAGVVGLEFTHDNIGFAAVQGIELRGPTLADKPGIRLRLSGRSGQHAKHLLIEDCKVSKYDDLINIVDDWARTQAPIGADGKPEAPGVEGRIKTTISRNILTESYGSDAHSVGIYIEGTHDSIIDGNVIDWIGWKPGSPEDRNARGHCIYAQSYNGPIDIYDNWLSRAAANALQLRAGGAVIGNVMSGCSLGPLVKGVPSDVIGNVLLDSTDIQPGDGVTSDSRGHAYIAMAHHSTIKGNIAARKGGSMANMRAFESMSGTSAIEHNLAVAWAPTNFNIDGVRHRDIGTNHTIDTDPGLPSYTPRLDRPRGVWTAADETQTFIDRCQEALA